jgi:hypothetical protein
MMPKISITTRNIPSGRPLTAGPLPETDCAAPEPSLTVIESMKPGSSSREPAYPASFTESFFDAVLPTASVSSKAPRTSQMSSAGR